MYTYLLAIANCQGTIDYVKIKVCNELNLIKKLESMKLPALT